VPSSSTDTLQGRVVIVTGGTRGIGREVAMAFLAAGCEVVVCSRNAPADLPTVADRTAVFAPCDVRNPEAVQTFVDGVAALYGRLDVVVNNAGGSPRVDAATASPRFSEAIVALNLLGPLYVAQAAYRWMAQQATGGSIINIASISGVRPSPGTAAYGAAKAGLLSLTRSLAQEWGPRVRVNAIIGGLIDTGTADATYGSAAAREQLAATLPLKRMGTGQDIAATVLFLASPAAAYISGAQIAVDGGGERPLFLDIVDAHAAAPPT